MKNFFRGLFRVLGFSTALAVVVETVLVGIKPDTGAALLGASIFLLMCEMVADGI